MFFQHEYEIIWIKVGTNYCCKIWDCKNDKVIQLANFVSGIDSSWLQVLEGRRSWRRRRAHEGQCSNPVQSLPLLVPLFCMRFACCTWKGGRKNSRSFSSSNRSGAVLVCWLHTSPSVFRARSARIFQSREKPHAGWSLEADPTQMSYCTASVAILKTFSLSLSLSQVIWCTRRLQLIPICFWSWTEPAWMKLVLI